MKKELVNITLSIILDSWHSFVLGICARKKVPKFEELWTTCTQEESRLKSKGKIQIFDEGDS